MSCGSNTAAIGREVKNHHGNPPLLDRATTQADKPNQSVGKALSPVGAADHVLCGNEVVEGAVPVAALAGHALGTRSATEDHGRRGAIELGNGHHNRGLHGQKATRRSTPLGKGLKLQGVCSNVGQVQACQNFFGRLGVVVGGAAHQGKTG